MNKLEALKLALDRNFAEPILNKYGVKYSTFVSVLSKESYNLKELGGSMQSRANLLKELLPNKPNNTRACIWILELVEHKRCGKCRQVLHFEDFDKNSAKRSGLGSQCRSCHYGQLVQYQPAVTAKRRAAKIARTPKWADLDKIKEIYNNCPKGYHVDHVIPLQGELVSGLHVENNLQYLLASDNISKSNKFMLE